MGERDASVGMVRGRGQRWLGAPGAALALGLALGLAGSAQGAGGEATERERAGNAPSADTSLAAGRLVEVPAQPLKMLNVRINLSTGEMTQTLEEVPGLGFQDGGAPGAVPEFGPGPKPRPWTSEPMDVPGTDGGVCDETVTHTNASFEGGQYVVQAGFAEGEAAGASYQLQASEFPLIFRRAEMIFATSQTTVTTTTEWTLLIFSGNPNTGQLVESFSSDNVILPHLVIPPGTNGVNILVEVDPTDPEQVVIQNSGNAVYSVAFRIDNHNNQTQNPCFIAPPTNSNAFPTTDVGGVAQPTRNWLFAVPCPFLPGGWYRFSDLGILQPSGDWVLRSTYVPFDCDTAPGACCLFSFCEILTAQDCDDAGGVFLGAGSLCTQCDFGACCLVDTCVTLDEVNCLALDGVFQGALSSCDDLDACDPGACCLVDGSCVEGLLDGECVAEGGVFAGPNTTCATTECEDPVVPCCFASTGGCLDLEFQVCLGIGGIPGAVGQACASFVCFPEGACCLPDGACLDALSPEECATVGGTFQGDGTSCATVSCPLPTGACCFANGSCLVFTQQNCTVAGGTWQGAGTNCADGNGNGSPDACEAPAPDCPGDVNGDLVVNSDDLGLLLGEFGCQSGCEADLNDDGEVNSDDLGLLLGEFGSDCTP
ncbi:MAG: dockerin type I repeat-containing protein [Phycisphaerales bacterium]